MVKKVNGYLSVLPSEKNNFYKENFTGEVFDKPVKFPVGLGAEHPFDFKSLEQVYKRVGFVAGTVNKYTDAIIGDFTIKAEDSRVQTLLDSFLKDTNFSTVMRAWIKEGILKGNGFMELDLDNSQIRVLNANNMYVKRNKIGKVLEYNQFTGDMKRFTRDSIKFNTFLPNKVAHLPINKIPNEAYAIGIIWPNEKIIESIVNFLLDLEKLSKRKAGQPIHVKVGRKGEKVNTKDIDAFKVLLQYMNNSTEWVTDADVEMNVLQFPDVGKNLTDTLDKLFRMFIAGVEVPEVLFGSGQLNEGIAKVQLESWLMKIKSIREQVEEVIEEKILKPYLIANGFDESVDFVWDLPTEEALNERLQKIADMLKNGLLSGALRAGLEIMYADMMDLDLENVLITPEEAKKEEELRKEEERKQVDLERKQEEEGEKQPEVPGQKPSAKESISTPVQRKICPKCKIKFNTSIIKCPRCKVKLERISQKLEKHNHITEAEAQAMTVKEWVNIQEIAGFNYSDYLFRILKKLRIDKFEQLLALSEQDLLEGLLPQVEIDKLRIILKDGFRKNQTIREIEDNIRDNVYLKDRLNGEGKLILSSVSRPINIARTETVRLANIGLVDTYKENDIKKVRFLAALSDRTCPICESLNSQVFSINELEGGLNQPPIHSMCRCSLLSVVE